MAKAKNPTPDFTSEELVQKVRAHAREKYGSRPDEGWDILEECWSDEDIVREIRGTKKESSAIWYCRKKLEVLAGRRREVQNETF